MYIFYVKLLDCMMENSYPIQLLFFIMLVAYAHFMLGIYIYIQYNVRILLTPK